MLKDVQITPSTTAADISKLTLFENLRNILALPLTPPLLSAVLHGQILPITHNPSLLKSTPPSSSSLLVNDAMLIRVEDNPALQLLISLAMLKDKAKVVAGP